MKIIKFNYQIGITDNLPKFTNFFEYFGMDQHQAVRKLYLKNNLQNFELFINSDTLESNDLTRWKNWIKQILKIKRKNIIKILKSSSNIIFVFIKD